MEKEEISIERQLVLMSSVEIDEPQASQFEKMLKQPVNWAEIIYQFTIHRTLNMLCYNLKKFSLFDIPDTEIKRLLNSQWQVYHERNCYYLEKLAEILNQFERYDLVVPILKGNLLASIVYPAIETRIFNDLDFLMKLDDINRLTEALYELGYIQGHYDEEKKSIVEASKKEKMLQQLSSHEIQEFQRVSDNRFAPLIQVDVNHDILWKGNCPYKVATPELIGRALPVEIQNNKGYMLDYIDNIIQLSCHLFKEATLMMWVSNLRDLRIYKFADLYMYIKKFSGKIDWDLFLTRVRHYAVEKVVYYNFYYIELMFGKIIPEHVIKGIQPENLDYLDEYAIENKTPSRWEFDFFTRLFDTNRILAVDPELSAGMQRFVKAKTDADGVVKI